MSRAFSVLALATLIASLAYGATLSGPAPNFTLQSNGGQPVARGAPQPVIATMRPFKNR